MRCSRRLLVLPLLFIAALGACSPVPRPALTAEKLEVKRREHLSDIRKYMLGSRDRIVRRMAMEAAAEQRGGGRACLDILMISGGGDYGAFGAGVLAGWGEVEPGERGRPVFDIATGVSTGALIAPFAFLGEADDYQRILRLYTEPSKDWFSLRGLLFFLPSNSSLTDNAGLRKQVEKEVDAQVLAKVAAGADDNRSLLIGTTDLDLGVMHPWDLTMEAQKVVTERREPKRFHDVLMASTAIPAVFPPVVIDGSLYVDGGTTSNILYDFDLRDDDAPVQRFKHLHAGLPVPRVRFWVIVNNQLGGTSRLVEESWLDITRVSVETAVRSSTLGALKQLSLQCELQRIEGLDVQFRYIAIPDDWKPVSSEPFNRETMRSLAELGTKLGAQPESWRSDIVNRPNFEEDAGRITPAAAPSVSP